MAARGAHDEAVGEQPRRDDGAAEGPGKCDVEDLLPVAEGARKRRDGAEAAEGAVGHIERGPELDVVHGGEDAVADLVRDVDADDAEEHLGEHAREGYRVEGGVDAGDGGALDGTVPGREVREGLRRQLRHRNEGR